MAVVNYNANFLVFILTTYVSVQFFDQEKCKKKKEFSKKKVNNLK